MVCYVAFDKKSKIPKYKVAVEGNDYFAILNIPDEEETLIKKFDSYVQLKLYYDLRGYQEDGRI